MSRVYTTYINRQSNHPQLHIPLPKASVSYISFFLLFYLLADAVVKTHSNIHCHYDDTLILASGSQLLLWFGQHQTYLVTKVCNPHVASLHLVHLFCLSVTDNFLNLAERSSGQSRRMARFKPRFQATQILALIPGGLH